MKERRITEKRLETETGATVLERWAEVHDLP